MSIIRVSGKPQIEKYKNAVSNVYSEDSLVYADGSGAVIPADSTSGNHIGIIKNKIAATDDLYATAGDVSVDICNDNSILECDVDGTLTTAMVGNFYDLTDASNVNVAAQSKNVVLCVGFISATKGLFKLNARATVVNVATT